MNRVIAILIPLGLLSLVGCSERIGGNAKIDETQAKDLYLTMLSGEAVEQDSGGPAQQRTGWATIRGKVTLQGDPPAAEPLTVNRDTEVCAPGGATVYSQSIKVGPNGELANLVIYARDLKGDNVHEDAVGDTGEVPFDQKVCIFLSHVQVMQKTQKLKILNSDPIGHNTNISADKAGTFNQNISPGGSAIYQPVASESQPADVSCSIHPWMKAYILPLDNAYGASSKQDGTFEIANLPAGIEVELQFWHERGSIPEVTVNGNATKLSRGRATFTLQEGEQAFDIVVPASAL